MLDWITNLPSLLSAEEWQAVGTLGTLLVAVAAAVVALVQVRQATRLREEQARPYVVAYIDRVAPTVVDLVIKNFGATVARDIALQWDRLPTIHRGQGVEAMNLAQRLPLLVPGQEWRTVWDIQGKRIGTEEPYTLTLTYRDARRRLLPAEPFELGTGHFSHAMIWDRPGLHEIGESLQRIEAALSTWSEGLDGVRVWSRNGDAKDEQRLKEWEEREASRLAAKVGPPAPPANAKKRAPRRKPAS
jgi:hypothetical protein